MNNELQIFNSAIFGRVRVLERNGEPCFVAKDVCDALGYTWSGSRISHVPDEWKGMTSVVTPGGTQEMAVLSEQGLYFFLGRSDKEGAIPLQKWIAGDILPSIRKHGAYLTPDTIEKVLDDPDTLIRLATSLKEERARRAALEQQAAVDRPKVVFADSIEVSKTSILIGELAKLIKQSTGYDVGQNRMFCWLRDNGYLHKHGTQKNMPTQRSIERGWFEIKEGTRIGSSGECHITKTSKVTGKGQIYFINLFADGHLGRI